MLLALLVAAQAAQAPPDIQLDLHASVRDVRIEQKGDTSLILTASPDGGTSIEVDKPEARGRRHLRDVEVRVRASARIADPAASATAAETERPQ